jgi:hypothetical protein
MDSMLDKEEQARIQKAGRERVEKVFKHVRGKARDFAGDFKKKWDERKELFDPEKMKIADAQFNAKEANQAVSDARVQANSDGRIDRQEKSAIEALERAAAAMENVANKLEFEAKMRDRNKMLGRPAHP